MEYKKTSHEKEEFEEFMIKKGYLLEDHLAKDDYGRYLSETVENLFYGWKCRKIYSKEKENQANK